MMFRNLPSGKLDDLEELRRMIKKTENNLRVYSQSVKLSLPRSTRLRTRSWMRLIVAARKSGPAWSSK
jgi:hypothetical protein